MHTGTATPRHCQVGQKPRLQPARQGRATGQFVLRASSFRAVPHTGDGDHRRSWAHEGSGSTLNDAPRHEVPYTGGAARFWSPETTLAAMAERRSTGKLENRPCRRFRDIIERVKGWKRCVSSPRTRLDGRRGRR